MSSGKWRFRITDLRRAEAVASKAGRDVEVDVRNGVIRLVKPNKSDLAAEHLEPVGEIKL
jgi:hypothetical protein